MLAPDDIVLIFGSINANQDDRNLERSEISTLQYIDSSLQVYETDLFASWGELGLGAMVFLPGSTQQFFITTGRSIQWIDLASKTVKNLKISRLRGIHEISIIKDILWISNTYYDEVIAYDYQSDQVLARHKLTPEKFVSVKEEEIDPEDTTRINKFHCNQVFETYEQEVYLLVHHVTGEQLVKRIAQKLVKSQGGGGVLDINSGNSHKLKLKAPHSVRLINDEYWVFDSGHGELGIFDRNWQKRSTMSIHGWGRGGCFLESSSLFFAGISAPRKRYLKFLDSTNRKNKVLAIDTSKEAVVQEWELKALEQVNNLYHVKREFLNALYENRALIERYGAV